MTGTSVIGIKYAEGVMLVADTLGSSIVIGDGLPWGGAPRFFLATTAASQ